VLNQTSENFAFGKVFSGVLETIRVKEENASEKEEIPGFLEARWRNSSRRRTLAGVG
jgi:hypothetical protein